MFVKTIFGFIVTAQCCFLLSCTLQINDSHREHGSDEQLITANYCGPKFLCHLTGHCVFYSWVCDNVSDCIGGEDEANCETNVCPEGYHRCNQTGQCVPYKWICEGSFMCPGHSGPLPCANYTCPLGKFKCTSGRCIPNYLICDGDPDCDDGSDETEQMCAIYCSSSTGKYLCAGGRKCISTMSQCDLIYDCPQMDDEYNCPID